MDDASKILNSHLGGFNRLMGLRFVHATDEEVIAEVEVGPQHTQPYGLVHGGVYAAMIETLSSTGAALVSMSRGQMPVGLENSTSFVHAVRSGTLRGRATPLTRGRKTQVWQVEIRDDAGRLAATGRVRLLCLEPGSEVAGQAVALENDEPVT